MTVWLQKNENSFRNALPVMKGHRPRLLQHNRSHEEDRIMTYAIPLGRIADHGRGSLGFGTTADVAAPGNLMTDDSDAGLVTIAGTGTGKGVSQVIPTALTYPG
jgi:hypothetical protein